MSLPPRRVGLAATRAPWAMALRNHIQDHAVDLEVESLLEATQLLRRDRPVDFLLVDDVSRVFSARAVAEAVAEGVFVIGVTTGPGGLGQAYLERLGAQLILAAETPVDEVVESLSTITSRRPLPAAPAGGGSRRLSEPAPRPGGGVISIWSSAAGGSGLTEALVGTAQELSLGHKVLVVELDPGQGVLAARLSRSPEFGLPWALARLRQGGPLAVAPPRDDGVAPVGDFALIPQAMGPTAPPGPSPEDLYELCRRARQDFDHVLISVGRLVVPAGGGRGRPYPVAGQGVWEEADVLVVGTTTDPLGGLLASHWRAGVDLLGVTAPAWLLFGRSAGSRYEEAKLVDLVQQSGGADSFARFCFLAHDDGVARARWDGDLIRRGRWHHGVRLLARELAQVTPGSSTAVERAPSPLVSVP